MRSLLSRALLAASLFPIGAAAAESMPGSPSDAGRQAAWEALEKAQQARYARTGQLMDSTVENFCFSATLRDPQQATEAVTVARDVRLCQGGLDPVKHRELLDRLRRFEAAAQQPKSLAPGPTAPGLEQ